MLQRFGVQEPPGADMNERQGAAVHQPVKARKPRQAVKNAATAQSYVGSAIAVLVPVLEVFWDDGLSTEQVNVYILHQVHARSVTFTTRRPLCVARLQFMR